MIDGVFSWLLLSDNKYDWASTPEKSLRVHSPHSVSVFGI